MKSTGMGTIAIVTALVSALGGSAMSAQDSTPREGGRVGSRFRVQGYEAWVVFSVSQDGDLFCCDPRQSRDDRGLRAGVPGNGKPFPDGSRWRRSTGAQKSWRRSRSGRCRARCTTFDFMVRTQAVRGQRRVGWAAFKYEAASRRFTPGTTADSPPQGTTPSVDWGATRSWKARDYVFTDYGNR